MTFSSFEIGVSKRGQFGLESVFCGLLCIALREWGWRPPRLWPSSLLVNLDRSFWLCWACAAALGRKSVKLVPDMTVLENVAIGAHLRGNSGAISSMLRLDRADEAKLLAEAARQIARVGLSDQIDQLAGSLSLGQQRIVEIARALCVDPMLLLLDEPAAGLRHMEKQRLAALLRQLRDGGMSVLLVEHDMGFVMDLADRIVVLDFGTKIAEGTPATIKRNPDVIKAYLGAAA